MKINQPVYDAHFTTEQLAKILPMIEQESSNFHGQLDSLYQVAGLLLVGQLYGWRVMRLVSTRSNWNRATKLFGDLKLLMPERGPLAEKSVGLRIADALGKGKFWEIIRGLEKLPQEQRKMVENLVVDSPCR